MNRETGGGSRFVFRPFIDLLHHPNNPHFFDPKTEIVIPKKISYIEIHFKNKNPFQMSILYSVPHISTQGSGRTNI